MRQWLDKQRKSSDRLHLTFEVSGQSGWLYDGLRDRVDSLPVSNPSQMTWIYRVFSASLYDIICRGCYHIRHRQKNVSNEDDI